MLYRSPELRPEDVAALATLEDLRVDMARYLHEPRRWFGTLRRATFAWAVQGSNSIEGYNASVEDVVAVMEDEPALDADQETEHAIAGYRDAMTYVLQLARDGVVVDQSLLKSLHFMMLKYDLSKHPGGWRPGAVWVDDPDGATVYTAPDRELLDGLLDEFVADVATSGQPTVVRAAMAHLNLVLIHPFSDGNGRMARCIQSLLLAADGQLSPVFASIEEYLGRNTAQYYRVLSDVGGGAWHPSRDTCPWIEFCITAHVRQARTLLRRVRETEELWDRCEQLVDRHRLPRRCVGPLNDAARGWRLRRALYSKLVTDSTGESISEQTATRDLAALVKAGLLEGRGEKRARIYLPTPDLRGEWDVIRQRRPARDDSDPYAPPAQGALFDA